MFLKTLRMPPALKAGIAKDVWSYEQLVELVDRGGAESATTDQASPNRA